MRSIIKFKEVDWYRIIIGVLLLIILIMAFKMNPKLNIDIDNGKLLERLNVNCFTKDDLGFNCEETNEGNFIPITKNSIKYWRCEVNGTRLYEVKAC